MSETRMISRNPVDLLSQEHLLLASLLDAYRELQPTQVRKMEDVFRRIEHEISRHIATEELLFYPTLLTLNDPETREAVARALEGHRRMESLLVNLRGSSDACLGESMMAMLCNYALWHMDYEGKELFPRATRLSSVTLHQLGLELEARLMREGAPFEDDG